MKTGISASLLLTSLIFSTPIASLAQDPLAIDQNGKVAIAKDLAVSGRLGVGAPVTTDSISVVASVGEVNSGNGALSLTKSGPGGQSFRFYYAAPDSTLFFGTPGLRLGGFGMDGSVALGGLNADNLTTGKLYLDGPRGNLGIGTASPAARLDIGGNETGRIQAIFTRGLDGNFQLVAKNGDGGNNFGAEVARFGIQYSGQWNSGFRFLRGNGSLDGDIAFDSQGSERLRITSIGNVGIGTASPRAKLEISGFSGYALPISDQLTLYNQVTRATLGQVPMSILTSNWIGAQGIQVFSDARAKNILSRSDGAADLRTLMGIEIADFQYKDRIGKGEGTYKKVVAQQVEKVYPQAVTRQTDVIPDIYRFAPVHEGWIELVTDLKKGERVRLIDGKAADVYEVLETAPTRFRTSFNPEAGKLFVFGREVNDFRSVDYDAIAMLNVSATQQMKKDTDAEIAALKGENAELQSRVRAIEDLLRSAAALKQ